MPTIGGIVFPGSNCEQDALEAITSLGSKGQLIWHDSSDLGNSDAVIIPGGFPHGDYLRPGASARFSPGMESVLNFANSGRPVLGICNGFQILTEAGLLPGALQKKYRLEILMQNGQAKCANNEFRSYFPIGQRRFIKHSDKSL